MKKMLTVFAAILLICSSAYASAGRPAAPTCADHSWADGSNAWFYTASTLGYGEYTAGITPEQLDTFRKNLALRRNSLMKARGCNSLQFFPEDAKYLNQ